ncbi:MULTISPECIES: hypothetical protein [unclassified Bradyrhizobium]|uniref:hypothetical protein n=1 Tax=unclassified Bradyrhizobium TaxID=2631580 RepID=UPI002916F560|nr:MULTISPECIES: hypothetical protein [unclassified Bradyrhizobium]
MFTSILGTLGLPFINKFFETAASIFVSYNNKQISKEEAIDKLLAAMLQAARDIEVAHAEALTKILSEFYGAMKSSRIIRIGWLVTLLSQVFVLSWAQWAVPFLIWTYGGSYPSNGELVQWAYLLIAFQLGGGPIILRAGPGKGSIVADMRAATIKQKGEGG